MVIKKSPRTKFEKSGKREIIKATPKKTQPNELVTRVHDLAWMGQHSRAIELATQALGANKIKSPVQMDLLDLRAESYLAQGKLDLAAKDVRSMMKLANIEKLPALKTQALNRKTHVELLHGDLQTALKTANAAIKNAQRSRKRNLTAQSLLNLSEAQFRIQQSHAALETAQEAAALFQELGDASGAGRAYWSRACAFSLLSRNEESRRAAMIAMDLCQQAGDQLGIGNALNALTITDVDIIDAIRHLQQASRAIEMAGYAERKTGILTNLALNYTNLGLYRHSYYITSTVVELSRSMGAKLALAVSLGNLTEIEIVLGMLEEARAHGLEIAAFASSIGDPAIEAGVASGWGSLALAEGDSKEAVRQYKTAVHIVHQTGTRGEEAFLTQLGQAYLAKGDPVAALKATTKASDIHRLNSFAKSDIITSQEIWWRHAQALLANNQTTTAREALDRAYGSLLEAIANLRDEGLRRNYLNKVATNRELLAFWVKDGVRRKLPRERIFEYLSIESNLREPFQRLADTGLRLNALHTFSEIQTFLVEEATELIGGERVVLVLEKDGSREIAESILPRGEDTRKLLRSIDLQLSSTRLTRSTNLVLPKKFGLSRIVAPLIAQNQVLGYLYTDMDTLYGRFNETDRDMLGMLANQAAVALDNAQWTQGLEQKVEHRTEQLNARVDELAILNSVGEAMAKTLDVKTVTRIVGDKIRDIFHAEVTEILLLDSKSTLIHVPYAFARDYQEVEPFRLGEGLTSKVIQLRQPLLIGTFTQGIEMGALAFIEEDKTESYLGVPIIVGEKVLGVVSIQSYQKDAYNENHLRLLQTLSANMGVAIENARLFEAEQQRVAELAVINSVQQGLAAQLDMQAIYDLVGDKVREIFDAQVVLIDTFDLDKGTASNKYMIEKGQRYFPEPRPPFLLHKHIARIREVMLFNQNAEKQSAELGMPVVPGTKPPKSMLFVPLIVGDLVKGMISLQNVDHENAFSDSDVRLLQTLANSMSVALENARLFDETQHLLKETEERNSELAVINSVQQGLAAELDFQAIVDLVGDKLRHVFNTPNLNINWFDEKAGLVHFLYAYEHGARLTLSSLPLRPKSIIGRVIKTRQNVVWNSEDEGNRISPAIPGTDASKSGVSVPIISSDRVLGTIQLENYERENAYGESELRLLTTIAGSLGAALENAHLFDETQRLLKETEQRAAELAIINSVQAALAAELNIQGIYDAVGDKIREIFHQADVGIRIYEPQTNFIHYPYAYENGKRTPIDSHPLPATGFSTHVLRTRTTVVINENMAKEVEKYGSFTLPGTEVSKSLVMVPLVSGNQARGLIDIVDMEHEHAFNESDVRLLQTLANSMSVALENARLFDETQRLLKETEQRNAELAVINSIQQGLAAELNFQAIIDLVGDKLRQVLDTGDVGIRWYDSQSNIIHYLYEYEHDHRIAIPSAPPQTKSWFQLFETRQPVVLNTRAEMVSQGLKPAPGTDQSFSMVNVPIIASDRVIGSIISENYERENAFSEADIRLLQTVAASMGAALENARLFNETQRLLKETEQRNSELAFLNSISDAMSRTLDLKMLTRIVGDKVREIFNSDSAIIMLLDRKTNLINIPYEYDRNEGGYIDYVEPFPLGKGLSSKVIMSGQPLMAGTLDEEIANGAYFPPEIIKKGSGFYSQSWLGVPILVKDQALGLIALSDARTHAFSESHLRLMQTLSSNVGVAIENARLFQEEQQRVAELAIINSVQAALAAELNIQGIYDTVGDKIREIFHDTDLGIRIYDPGTNLEHFPYTYENGKRIIVGPDPLPEKGFSAHVLRTRQTLVINENMSQAIEKYGSYTMPGTQMEKSGIWVPLVVGDQARGLICLTNMEREHAFNDSDVRLLQTLANSMSVALENARLFDETQRLLKETEQRAAELAIINSVQEALASKLDMQAIYDLVGDKIQSMFNAQSVIIQSYDHEKQLSRLDYAFENGEHFSNDELHPFSIMAKHLIATRQPVVINRNSIKASKKYGLMTAEGTQAPRSLIFVPFGTGTQVNGSFSLQNFDRENAFSESDVRLLQTLAGSMGIALENARLFGETQRLLKETEQRNSELAIINETQQALASKLDIQAMVDLFGDEIMRIFPPPQEKAHTYSVYIALYDPQTNIIEFPYLVDGAGNHFEEPPTEFGPGLTSICNQIRSAIAIKNLG